MTRQVFHVVIAAYQSALFVVHFAINPPTSPSGNRGHPHFADALSPFVHFAAPIPNVVSVQVFVAVKEQNYGRP